VIGALIDGEPVLDVGGEHRWQLLQIQAEVLGAVRDLNG
jgi:hypothetical protein